MTVSVTGLKSIQDCKILQEDMNHLAAWANKWCMRFEPSKGKTTIGCKINDTLDRLWRIFEYPKPR